MHKGLEDFQNYIFDMDGTLIDSSQEVLECLRKACEKSNAEINQTNFSSDVIGPPLKDIIKAIIVDFDNEGLIAAITADFREIYDNDEQDSSNLYDNVLEWLIYLKNSGKRLFLATNKPTKPTLRLLRMLNLDMFEDFYTIDKYPSGVLSKSEMVSEIIEKYELDKSKTIMIGDAPSDIKAGHSCGIKSCGVTWGYGKDRDSLKNISDYILNLEDLKVLERI